MEIKKKKDTLEKGKLVVISEKPKIIVYFDGEKLSENEIKKNQTYKDDIENHIANRTFKNQKDYQFFKKIDKT